MSNDWNHQYQYNIVNTTINEIIESSREEASDRRYEPLFNVTLGRICVDMKVHDNASALDVYNNIINNPSEYPTLTDAAIDSMNDDGSIGSAGWR